MNTNNWPDHSATTQLGGEKVIKGAFTLPAAGYPIKSESVASGEFMVRVRPCRNGHIVEIRTGADEYRSVTTPPEQTWIVPDGEDPIKVIAAAIAAMKMGV